MIQHHEAIQADFGWYNEHLYQFQKEPYSRGWTITDTGRNSDTCPPEDCGGPFRYEYMKQVLHEEPDSEEAQDYREWLGLEEDEEFDPDGYVENYIDDIFDDFDLDDDE